MCEKDIECSISSRCYSRNVEFDEQENGIAPVEDETSVQDPLILDPVDKTKSDKENDESDEESGSTVELPTKGTEQPTADDCLRRSTRVRRRVDYYGSQQVHITIHHEPTSFEEATNSPEMGFSQWKSDPCIYTSGGDFFL